MAWVLSLTSILMLWLMGNKSIWGPKIGIANQGMWFAYVIVTEQWGLVPGVIAFTVIHFRNAQKWEREQ